MTVKTHVRLFAAIGLMSLSACGTTPGLHDCDPCIYVASAANGEVTVIDGVTNAVVHTIPAGLTPQFIAVSPDNTRVYVSTHSFLDNDLVTVIDTGTYDIVANIAVGKNPTGLVVSPDGTRLYVVNSADDTMSVIDTGSNAVIDTVPVAPLPFDVAISPDGSRLYLSSESEGAVQILETANHHQVGEPISVGVRASGLALNGTGTRLYAADHRNGTVAVVNTATHQLVVPVTAGSEVIALRLHPNGDRLYTANMSGLAGNDVSTVDLSTMLVATIPVGALPHGIALVYVGETDPPDEAIHFVSAVNGAPRFEPETTTTVATDDFVSFTVRAPALMAASHADVRYYLNPNLKFIGASTGAQKASVCTPVPSALPLPNGVQSGAQRFDCLLSDPGQPLIVHARVSSFEAPRDDPYAGVVCLSPPLDDCLPVRLAVQPPPDAVLSIGTQRTAIILVSSHGAQQHPFEDADMTASVFYSASNAESARNYFLEASSGLTTIVGSDPETEGTATDVYGPYEAATAYCNFSGVDSPIVLADKDLNYENYEHVVYITNGDSCTKAGSSNTEPHPETTGDGVIPLVVTMVNAPAFGETVQDGKIGDTTLHEFGHSLGVSHASSWDCGAASQAANNCVPDPYFEPTNLVNQAAAGSHFPHPHSVHKERFGWLEGGRVLPVWNSGTHTIHAYEDATENVKVLKIPRKLGNAASGEGLAHGYYYLSFRRPEPPWTDWATVAPSFTNGVAIHMDETGYLFADGALLDATPGSVDGRHDFHDGALLTGHVFFDSLSQVVITVTSVTATQATVQVDIPPRATRYLQVTRQAQTTASVDIDSVGSVTGGGSFTLGETATLTATAAPGWAFNGWWDYETDPGGVLVSHVSPYQTPVEGDRVLVARFAAAPPANDHFADAIAVPSLPWQHAMFMGAATAEGNEPLPGVLCGSGSGYANSIWYRYTPTVDQVVTVDTHGSGGATDMAIYTGSTLDTLTPVPGTCATWAGPGQHVDATFSAQAGVPYYIQFDATTGQGNYSFTTP